MSTKDKMRSGEFGEFREIEGDTCGDNGAASAMGSPRAANAGGAASAIGSPRAANAGGAVGTAGTASMPRAANAAGTASMPRVANAGGAASAVGSPRAANAGGAVGMAGAGGSPRAANAGGAVGMAGTAGAAGAPARESGARPAGWFRYVLTAAVFIAVSLFTLFLMAYSGVRVPIVSEICDMLTGGNAGGLVGGSAGGATGAATGATAGGAASGNTGGPAGAVAGGATDTAAGATAAGAAATDAGVPYELKGSGGAWDGSAIRLPYLSVSYDAGEETEFCLYKDFLAECSCNSFCLLDKAGADVYRKNIDFIKPAMYKQGDYLLVSDLGGRTAFVLKGSKLVWEETFTSGIVNASINRNGYIVFVLEEVGYRNCVRVYAPVGKTLFDWIVADDYVIGAEVAPSGDTLVINRLKTSGINVSSGLEFLDMQSEPFMSIDSGDDEVFLDAGYLDDNSLAVATDRVFSIYSETGDVLVQETFESVTGFCEFPRKSAVVAVRRKNRVLLIEYGASIPKGRALAISDIPVLNLSADGSYLFANYGGAVTIIGENGKIASNLTLDEEALYGGASGALGALVVTKNSADIYSLRG